ncbi:DNA-binding response regulator [Paramagnetospirillum kuznetsovii]|uniref:DNA-binding response regulator n=1 Tax=Paramagnetospirillum kuznetsovii TaxID=2053833 RepID=A0A364P340_9PROT|nr:response regulator transcription factor [Paramagnetospirillum kuznetsovii]RAU23743.1 DNA-binding response regulator [Paramagnetospirillum kuznetsovii]
MTGPSRILLVVADAMLRQTMAEHLETAAAMSASQAEDMENGIAQAEGHDLIVVDDAFAPMCRTLRDHGSAAALLLLSASASLPVGCPADGVLAKPLRLSALAGRITELLSRRAEPEEMRIGPWLVDCGRRVLVATDGRKLRLTDKETAILVRLAQAAGQAVARETLLAEVWGYGAGMDTHTLETHIYRLRRKIEPKGAPALLLSENGGYRLVL